MPDSAAPSYAEVLENQELAAPIDIDAPPVENQVSPRQLRLAQNQENAAEKFPMVGLGGSAGSLQAFEAISRALPPTPGMAFVVVMHLAPDQPSELPAVLQRFTPMPVHEATDGLKVRLNHVYVIPPDRDMSMLHGTLLLFQPIQARGRRLPIDFFFQSLAKDARERAICIICSGMGSDGTVGLKMVMENFGMVMVQSPETAEYDSMPRSAIATEFVDYVLPADQLPAKLLEYIHKPLFARPRREQAESDSQPAHALQKIFILIRAQTGHDFSFYKRNTVFRRIERRMNAHQMHGFTQYVRYLQENPTEVEALFRELLIGVTKFFRDPDAYKALQRHLLPLLRGKPTDSTVRVWAPGCSTGEETYSLAMLLLESLDAIDPARYLKLQLFATDINPAAIDFARAGLYPPNITADVSPERLQRFFVRQPDGSYQITKEVRDVVIFAVHSLTKDTPFTKLDLLCCRNLLIYLSAELQKNLLPIFHYALNPSSLLFLGPSENLTGYQELFIPLDMKWKISRRNDASPSIPRLVNFPFSLSQHSATAAGNATTMSTSSPRKSGPFAQLLAETTRQQQLVLSAILTTQEEERRRIAEALHNGVGQLLYATRLHLTQLPDSEALRAGQQLLQESIRATRTISFELTPRILEDFGLPTALRELADRVPVSLLRLRLSLDGLDDSAQPLPPPVQMAVYRIVQELLSNVMKHAQAREVTLLVARQPGQLRIRIADDGVGFVAAPVPASGDIGLAGIRNRVELLGGALGITSAPHQGTTIAIELPLAVK
ncbi:hypothetical protein D0N36_10665 [Hymenobacter lapidiphilus]|uniref:chemotaxis protein CheB n=1 Tax=Hymenobacter sp. CCM 8763 TaxID=2303334 RepID=UPI000E34811A|nr:chemotaxis protein CheB [Hymenobacter sp. CCM 8763]RFP65135.1 hypothetical protein D0N36_10665 [Hymenobacter sp. CCM 8763]